MVPLVCDEKSEWPLVCHQKRVSTPGSLAIGGIASLLHASPTGDAVSGVWNN